MIRNPIATSIAVFSIAVLMSFVNYHFDPASHRNGDCGPKYLLRALQLSPWLGIFMLLNQGESGAGLIIGSLLLLRTYTFIYRSYDRETAKTQEKFQIICMLLGISYTLVLMYNHQGF